MMMNRRHITVSILLFAFLPLSSQDRDFGIWYSATLKHEVIKNLELNLSGELRTFRNAGRVDEGFLETGFEYRVLKFLDAGFSYRLTDALEDDSEYHLQHKLFLDLKANSKISDFSLSARIRFQSRFRTYYEYADDKIPDYTMRLKLKAGYNIPAFPVNPYVYFEPFFPLNKEPEKLIGKYRLAAGLELRITKRHSVDAEYIFQRDLLPDISELHVVSLAYNFRF